MALMSLLLAINLIAYVIKDNNHLSHYCDSISRFGNILFTVVCQELDY